MPHLVIMAAGTGGHIIPGIAVAREVQRRGWSVSWLGWLTGGLRLQQAFWHCHAILRRRAADAVLGMALMRGLRA